MYRGPKDKHAIPPSVSRSGSAVGAGLVVSGV